MTQSIDHLVRSDDQTRLNVLLVEDSYPVAQSFTFLMEEYDWDIIGPAPTIDAAMKLVEQFASTIDVAVLDINLQGHSVAPVAQKLRELSIPFVFLTGYGDADAMLPAHFEEYPTLLKPVREEELIEKVNALIKSRFDEDQSN